ncbi:MAG: DUF5317 family protein [Acidimicrobiia bacterium]
MSFIVASVAVALGVALLSGGTLRSVLETRLRAPWALFGALAVQVALDLFWRRGSSDLGHALLVGSYVALVCFCLANLRLRGMAVVAIGIASNALVIAVNEGMPVRTPPGTIRETVKHHAERPSDDLTALSDIIVVDHLNQALSFGDLIMVVGLADLLFHRSRANTRRAAAPGALVS